jgi:hypothetical protein
MRASQYSVTFFLKKKPELMKRKIKFEVVQELNIKKRKNLLCAQQNDGFTICLDIDSNLADLP